MPFAGRPNSDRCEPGMGPGSLRLLGVFAHPDDETFCAGGTLARYASAGAEVLIVSATQGEAGQIRDAGAATRRTLGQVRERELREACRRLGVLPPVCLGFPDTGLSELDPGVLRGEVVRIIREFRPEVVITFDQEGGYGHPDHIAVSEAVTNAFSQAGSDEYFPEQIAAGLVPHTPDRLYYSLFRRSRLLLLVELSHWLIELGHDFRAGDEFVHAMSFFAKESTTLQYANDYVQVNWYPPGTYIVEQGEAATALYLILSGEADVVHEEPDGTLHTIRHIGAGQFFGELALVYRQPRTAHVIAASGVTCLALSMNAPSTFGGRGADARLVDVVAPATEQPPAGATTRIDVLDYVDVKMAAITAHRTQYPMRPDMFPRSLLAKMLAEEYFLRVQPAVELETELHPRPCATIDVPMTSGNGRGQAESTRTGTSSGKER